MPQQNNVTFDPSNLVAYWAGHNPSRTAALDDEVDGLPSDELFASSNPHGVVYVESSMAREN